MYIGIDSAVSSLPFRAGKNEDDTNQPVADGGDSLVPQCKEDWEQSWTPPTAMPDQTSSASITHQQPTVYPQTSQASTGSECFWLINSKICPF